MNVAVAGEAAAGETWCPAPLRPFAVSLLIDTVNGALPLAQPWLSCGCCHLGREPGRRDSLFKATCLLELTSDANLMTILGAVGAANQRGGSLTSCREEKEDLCLRWRG